MSITSIFINFSYSDMKADYGSTKQISKALSKAFESLPSRLTRPVSIFLLTDGAAWDVHECISKTEAAIRERSTPENFMRVFTVGLGDGASTDTCDGIARAGRGMATYIITPHQQTFLGQCKRLLDAARTLPVSNFSVRMNNAPQGQNVGPLPHIQQAPTNVPFLNGTRTSIFMIVPYRASVPTVEFYTSPSSIAPVRIRPQAFNTTGNFFHTVAAKGIITDLEDTYVYSSAMQAESKRDIVLYGTTYGLTSRFTSYVAIDDNRAVGIGTVDIPKRSVMNSQPAVRLGDPMPQPMNRALEEYAPRVASYQAENVSYTIASSEFEELNGPGSFAVVDDPTAILFSRSSLQIHTPPSNSAQQSKQPDDPPPYQPEVGSHLPEIIYVDASEPEKLNNPGSADTVVDDSNVFTPPGNSAQQPKQPDDPTAILSSLSSLQNVDGGFGTKAADVMGLILPLSPSNAVQLLDGYDTNIVAALLAWLWMAVWGGIEAITMTEKLNKWIRENANADLDVDAIQIKLYEASSPTD
jgi:hypothetical protein